MTFKYVHIPIDEHVTTYSDEVRTLDELADSTLSDLVNQGYTIITQYPVRQRYKNIALIRIVLHKPNRGETNP